MSKRQIEDYLQDILDAMNAAESFIEGINFKDFQSDQKTIFAVTRAIEIIGEAAKSIPISLREQYPLLNYLGSYLFLQDKIRVLGDFRCISSVGLRNVS